MKQPTLLDRRAMFDQAILRVEQESPVPGWRTYRPTVYGMTADMHLALMTLMGEGSDLLTCYRALLTGGEERAVLMGVSDAARILAANIVDFG